MIEEYRAGATYDFALDEADRSKKRISCPMLVLTCLKDDLHRLLRHRGHLAGMG